MKPIRPVVLLAALAAAAAAPQAGASGMASSASSTAAQAGSSASDSLGTSSNTSSDSSKQKQAMNGDFRVDAVYAVAGQPDRVRLQLVPLGQPEAQGFTLDVPEAVLAETGVATGAVLTARERTWGVEFAYADKPFFNVIEDGVYRELQARPVTL